MEKGSKLKNWMIPACTGCDDLRNANRILKSQLEAATNKIKAIETVLRTGHDTETELRTGHDTETELNKIKIRTETENKRLFLSGMLTCYLTTHNAEQKFLDWLKREFTFLANESPEDLRVEIPFTGKQKGFCFIQVENSVLCNKLKDQLNNKEFLDGAGYWKASCQYAKTEKPTSTRNQQSTSTANIRTRTG